MPAFSSALAAIDEDYYNIVFLEDGYPGQRKDDGEVWAHPIYGVYVLNDYLDQYRNEPTEELREGIRTVAEAAVSRMDKYEGTLVFWYPAGIRSRMFEATYSGLTQSYYASSLHRAGEALDAPELVEAAAEVFDSMTIPPEDGGVMYEDEHGVSFAEVPQEPNSYVLNGWQSALFSMQEYADLSGSKEAARLVQDSAANMERLLPLYDYPEISNSRYGLTGFTYLRLVFDETPDALTNVRIDQGGQGTQPLEVGEGSRWEHYVLADDMNGSRPAAASVWLNTVLTLADGNELLFEVDPGNASTVIVEALVGQYDPLTSSPVDGQWETIATRDVSSHVGVEIPDEVVARVVQATSFTKELEGEQVNVYHSIHINRLRELADLTGLDAFSEWADRWEGYVCDWAEMSLYEGLMVRSYGGIAASVVTPEEYCSAITSTADG